MPDIPAQALDEQETAWKPLLQAVGEEDAHWDWRAILSYYDSGHRPFSITVAGKFEALLLVKEQETMRGLRDAGRSCCYIAYMAVAPWNRRSVRKKLQFSQERLLPLGSCLVLRAIELSSHLGHGGRLAWHALPGSVATYQRMFPALVCCGFDHTVRLDWFEIGVGAASSFRKGMQPTLAQSYMAFDGAAP